MYIKSAANAAVCPTVPNYIPSIDGLRALAVIAVILNHLHPGILPGGHLGVDIFFVISGFVITRQLHSGESSPLGEFLRTFYMRRVKRLLPALLFCLLGTSALISCFVETPQVYFRTGGFALLGLSNLELYISSTDYYSLSAQFNPFTHTWSLGVEEQFYLFFPTLFWVLVASQSAPHYRGRFLAVLVPAGLVSMAAFVVLKSVDPVAAHYLSPLRFWQLAFGGIASAIVQIDFLPLRRVFRQPAGLFLSITLLATLALPISPQDFMPHVIVSLLTALLVLGLAIGANAQTLWQSPILVKVGLLSYSLYLWHWPLIVLFKVTVGVDVWTIPPLLATIGCVSLLSYHFIEKPTRYCSWLQGTYFSVKPVLIIAAAVSLLLAMWLGVHSFLYTGKPQVALGSTGRAPIECNSEPLHLVSAGNSHARHIEPMLAEMSEICPMTYEVPIDRFVKNFPEGKGSPETRRQIIETVTGLQSNDVLILSSRNHLLYRMPHQPNVTSWKDMHRIMRARDRRGWGLSSWLQELDLVIGIAAKKGVDVVFFMPNIEFNAPVVPAEFCDEQWFRSVKRVCDSRVERDFLERRFGTSFYEQIRLRGKLASNFYLFDPLPLFCPGRKACSRVVDQVAMLSDSYHLTEAGAMMMVDPFVEFLLKNKIGHK